MAGIASCFPSKPLLTRTLTATPSHLDSKLFRVRLFNIGTIKSSSIFLSSTLGGSCITARYGGGFRPSGPRNSGQYRKSDSDDHQALDISTIRSATVRLIDEKQNMVGVLSKNEAIQMVEDAELDLVIHLLVCFLCSLEIGESKAPERRRGEIEEGARGAQENQKEKRERGMSIGCCETHRFINATSAPTARYLPKALADSISL